MYVIRFLLVLVALLVVGVAGWLIYRNPQVVGLAPESAAPGEQAGGKPGGNRIPGLIGGGAVNVVTAPVQMDSGGETVMALGTAKAVRSVTLYPQVTGMVTEMLFQPGQPVEAGKPLVQLENDDQAVALDRARVTREQARLTLERSQALAKTKTISGVALSDAETAAQLADIEIRSAEIALRHRSVTAPFAGVTGLTDITVGDLVTPSTAITTLDDLATLRVNFEVPERWAGQIVMGQPIVGDREGAAGQAVFGQHHRHRQPRRRDHPHAAAGGRDRQSRRGAEDRHGGHRHAPLRQRRASSPCRALPCNGTGAAPSSGRTRTAPRDAPRSPSSGGRAASSSWRARCRPATRSWWRACSGCARAPSSPRSASFRTIIGERRLAGRAAGASTFLPSASAAIRQRRADGDGEAAGRRPGQARTRRRRALSALCVRRPVLTIVFNLLIVVAGLAAFRGVEIRELPDIDRPVITIRATYDGATPETIDTQVTTHPGGRRIAHAGRGVDLLVEPLRPEPHRRRVRRFDRPQRRRQRPARRGRQRRAPAARRRRGRHHRQGRRQFRRHHPARGHRQQHADPGPDASSSRTRSSTALRQWRASPTSRSTATASRWCACSSTPMRSPRAASPSPTSKRRWRPSRSTIRPAASRATDQALLVRADASVASGEEIAAIRINRTTRVGDVADVIFGPAETDQRAPHQRQDRHRARHRPPGAVEHARHFRGHPRRRRRAQRVAPRRRVDQRHLRRRDLHRRRAREGPAHARSRRRSSSWR